MDRSQLPDDVTLMSGESLLIGVDDMLEKMKFVKEQKATHPFITKIPEDHEVLVDGLRNYQRRCVATVLVQLQHIRCALVNAMAGTGKTFILLGILKAFVHDIQVGGDFLATIFIPNVLTEQFMPLLHAESSG